MIEWTFFTFLSLKYTNEENKTSHGNEWKGNPGKLLGKKKKSLVVAHIKISISNSKNICQSYNVPQNNY